MPGKEYDTMNAYDSLKYALDNGRMIFRRPTLISLLNEYAALRSQLAEKDAEIKRLMDIINYGYYSKVTQDIDGCIE